MYWKSSGDFLLSHFELKCSRRAGSFICRWGLGGAWNMLWNSADPMETAQAVRTDRTCLNRGSARRVTHFAPTVISLILLAALFGSLVPYLQARTSACRMSCCASGKNCCCRSHPAGVEGTSSWGSVKECPGGCAQRPGLAGSPAATATPARIPVGAAPQAGAPIPIGDPVRTCTDSDFALFGRPPPTS
jgi:hypothetical protein